MQFHQNLSVEIHFINFSRIFAKFLCFRLDVFLTNCVQIGFFLNVYRFRAATDLQLPPGHPSYPSLGVLNAVYLWGAHFLRSEPMSIQEHDFLVRAVQNNALDTLTIHPSRILDVLQAEILLSYYFFRVGRFPEVKIHAGTAVSLALAFGLHRINPSNISSTSSSLGDSTSPSINGSDDIERINGFWAVFTLHKFVTVALEMPSSVCGALEAPGIRVDTPWPSDFVTYVCTLSLFFFSFWLY